MKRLWSSQHVQTVLISFLILACTVLCSPIGWSLIIALQVASLPESWYPVVHLLRGLTFLMPMAWIALSVSTPALALVPLAHKKYHKYRRFVPVFLAAWIISWGSWLLRPSTAQLRNAGLIRITQRAKPLINAVETYRMKNGRYPQQLSDLVPTFINKIPYTGAVGYPNFEYRVSADSSLFKTYEIRVKTPVGGINWDVFVYWPEKNYPSQLYGGGIERIGDWAYVHE